MLTTALLNFNGSDTLKESIQSVLDQTLKPGRFVIIDNASTDNSRQIAVDMGVKIIDADNKFQFITGLNTALSLCIDQLFFMQNDVVLDKNCLKEIIKNFDPKELRQPVIYQQNGKIDNAGMKWKWPGYGIGYRPSDKDIGTIAYETDIVTTIAFLISKEIIEKVGFFDTDFSPAYYEDCDYNLRLSKLGYYPVVVPSAKCIHLGNHTFSQTYRKKEIREICRMNRKKLIKKHCNGVNKWIRLIILQILDFLVGTLNLRTSAKKIG